MSEQQTVMSQATAPRGLWATRGVFLAAGVVVGGWAPLVPYVKSRLDLSDASLGGVLLATGVGSLLSTPLAAWLVRCYGSRGLVAVVGCLLGAALPLLAWVPSVWGLALALSYFGACEGLYNVALNVQVVAVERGTGRSLMSGFHAMYSVGGPISAAGTSLLLAAGVPPVACMGLIGLLVAVLVVGGRRYLPPPLPAAPPLAAGARWWRHLSGPALLLGGLCFISFMAEGSALDWGGLLLREYRGMPAQTAGFGYALFAAGMALGRLGGDRMIARLGLAAALTASAWLAAGGFLFAISLPWAASSLLGLAVAGLGIANVVPILFGAAGRIEGRSAGTSIAIVSTLGCIGLLSGPALIGFIAHASSLPQGLQLVVALLLLMGLGARTLKMR